MASTYLFSPWVAKRNSFRKSSTQRGYTRRPPHCRRRMSIEPLESRTLLAAAPVIDLNGDNQAGIDFAATYVEDAPPVHVTDSDANITAGKVVVGADGIYVLGVRAQRGFYLRDVRDARTWGD